MPKVFNTAAQDSNPGSHGQESEALPLSHCALRTILSRKAKAKQVHICVFVVVLYCMYSSYCLTDTPYEFPPTDVKVFSFMLLLFYKRIILMSW